MLVKKIEPQGAEDLRVWLDLGDGMGLLRETRVPPGLMANLGWGPEALESPPLRNAELGMTEAASEPLPSSAPREMQLMPCSPLPSLAV